MRFSLILVFSLALILAPAGLTSAWTQENADDANTGHLPRDAPTSLEPSQETPLPGDVIAQPVQGPASLALTGTLSGTLHALTATGDEAFSVDLGGEIRSAPLWTGDLIVTNPRSDTASAITPNGSIAWEVPIANEHAGGDPDASVVRMASPVPHPSGDVLIPTLEGQLLRVDPGGDTVWTFEAGEDRTIQSTPTTTNAGNVLVATFTPNQEEQGHLFLLDGDDGETIWDEPLDGQVVAGPTIVGDLVLIPLRDANTVEARPLSDPGTIEYRVAFDDRVTMSPSVHEGLGVAGDISGDLRAFDLETGDVEWLFHPTEDDPDYDPLGVVDVLAIADSPAIDANGHAWVPYWNAEIPPFPPEDSKESPFYILDIHDGAAIIDRETYPKAAHGSSLHTTGVWTGTDEQLIRSYPLSNTLDVHPIVDGSTVTLITNTDHEGDWTIDWGSDQEPETGTGTPPITTTRSLSPGTHTLHVTTDDATAQTTITIEDQAGSDDEEEPPQPDPDPDPPEDPDTEPDDPDADEEQPEDGQPIPDGLVSLVLALSLAAWRRRRA